MLLLTLETGPTPYFARFPMAEPALVAHDRHKDKFAAFAGEHAQTCVPHHVDVGTLAPLTALCDVPGVTNGAGGDW